MLIKKN